MNALFLLLGAAAFALAQGNLGLWAAAWIFAIPVLWVTRRSRGLGMVALVAVIFGVAGQLAMWRYTDDSPASLLFYVPLFAGLPLSLIFAADRWATSRLPGFLGTLMFPLLWTSFDFLLNLLNPLGTMGILGYSQSGFLPFAQLASITGMWGLTFMITWFASVAVWSVAAYRVGRPVATGVMVFSAVFAVIIAYGLLRVPRIVGAETIVLAGLHVHDRDREGQKMWKLLDDRNLNGFRAVSSEVLDALEAGTVVLAEQGAMIVVWSELSPTIVLADEAGTKERLSRLARSLQIYLLACPYVANLVGKAPENKAWLFGPDGALLLTHDKFGGNLLEGIKEGNRQVKVVPTDVGRIGVAICWDGDFPTVLRQVGRQNADLLLVPASDWLEIASSHARLTIFRGIENGCSVLRQTQNGISVFSDPVGRVMERNDHFAASEWSMAFSTRVRRAFALYPSWGDWFGWLAMGGTIMLTLSAARKRTADARR